MFKLCYSKSAICFVLSDYIADFPSHFPKSKATAKLIYFFDICKFFMNISRLLSLDSRLIGILKYDGLSVWIVDALNFD